MREKVGSNRRESPSVEFEHGPDDKKKPLYRVGIGLRDDGRCGEIFLNGMNAREGSDTQAILADLATMASLLIQHGHAPWDLARRLSIDGLARAALGHAASIEEEIRP